MSKKLSNSSDNTNDKIYKISINTLNPHQNKVLNECIRKGSGGMFLHMGYGKTRIALAILAYLIRNAKDNVNLPRMVIVCSITLVGEWIDEIELVYGDLLPYETILSVYGKKKIERDNWKIKENTRIIITTPTYLGNIYKTYDPNFEEFINISNIGWRQVKSYNTINRPTVPSSISGGLQIFSINWDLLIIDEVQNYVNISTISCRTICSISAKQRWALSGGPIKNPKIQNIMGYYRLINYNSAPNCVEDLSKFVKNISYKGINASAIVRKTNPSIDHIKIKKKIINHELYHEEYLIYSTFKTTLIKLNKKLKKAIKNNRTNEQRDVRISMLSMLTSLREALICPILPVANLAISLYDFNNKNLLTKTLNKEIQKLNIKSWLDDSKNVKSSRINAILKLFNRKNERIILLTSYRTSLNIIKYFCKNLKRPILTIESSQNSNKRKKVIDDFDNSTNGIILLTYGLGCEGLNLQSSRIVVLADFTWSDLDPKQGVGRIYRNGQTRDIKAYYFTSNTGIENSVLKKQNEKKIITDQIMNGPIETELTPMSFVNFVSNLVSLEDNISLINDIHINDNDN